MLELKCQHCGETFAGKTKRKIYCTKKCTDSAWAKANPKKRNKYLAEWLLKNPGYHKDYYQVNKDVKRDYVRNWRKSNPDHNPNLARSPEKHRVQERKYYESNPQKFRERSLKWAKANPEKVRQNNIYQKNKAAATNGIFLTMLAIKQLNGEQNDQPE